VTPVPHTGFATTCDSCHRNTDTTWSQKSAFNHSAYFTLVGAHATATCAKCHNPPYAPSANNYTAVPTTCIGCHQTDFNNAASPVPHTGFATTCDSCHRNTDTTWSQKSAFNHSAYFALAGAHVTAPCSQCHNPPYAPSANNYLTVPTNPCSACHLKDYNTATSPVNHVSAGFPTTCDACHKFSDATWLVATFSHATFPLVGVHATTACAVCHNPPYAPSANNYVTVPTTCYGCHVRDFNTATTPVPHAGFATTCDTCHRNTDATWLLASAFSHTPYFPITGGNHNVACNRCHTTATSYLVYNCIGCHTAGQTSPPAHHNGVKGYVWASTACYSCHPNGRAG
jgi:hypothetical protein